jgi:hypothetical protein
VSFRVIRAWPTLERTKVADLLLRIGRRPQRKLMILLHTHLQMGIPDEE